MLIHEIILFLLNSVINTHENRAIWQNSDSNEWLSESCYWFRLSIKLKLSGNINFIKGFTSCVKHDHFESTVVLVGDDEDGAFVILLCNIDFHIITRVLVVKNLLTSVQAKANNIEGLIVATAKGNQIF